MAQVSLLQILDLGATGLFLLAILFGRLIPKSWVERLLKQKDDQIIRLESQNDEYRKNQAPIIRLLETLNEAAERQEQEDEPHS